MSPSTWGTRKVSQTILPVFASSANIWPLPPLKSPPALPTKTRPSQAIGADGTVSPKFHVRDGRFPNSLAGLEVVGEHPPVLGAAKQHAVQVGGAAVGGQKGRGIVLVRSPILGASRRVEGENIELGRADQGAFHHDQAGLEGLEPTDIVGAEDLEPADIRRIDLAERREPVRSERSVVARPVFSGRACRRRRGGRRAIAPAPVLGVRFRRCRAWRGRPGNEIVAGQTRDCGNLDRVRLVDHGPAAAPSKAEPTTAPESRTEAFA